MARPDPALLAQLDQHVAALDVARVHWLVEHVTTPAEWLAGKVAERA